MGCSAINESSDYITKSIDFNFQIWVFSDIFYKRDRLLKDINTMYKLKMAKTIEPS